MIAETVRHVPHVLLELLNLLSARMPASGAKQTSHNGLRYKRHSGGAVCRFADAVSSPSRDRKRFLASNARVCDRLKYQHRSVQRGYIAGIVFLERDDEIAASA